MNRYDFNENYPRVGFKSRPWVIWTILTIRFIVLFLLITCASGDKRDPNGPVFAESTGVGSSEMEAVEAAKANAIKTIVGERVQGSSRVVNAQLESSNISTFFKGFVSQVKVLDSSSKDGLFKVKISCLVDNKELTNYIENVLVTKNKPRFMILVHETNLGQDIPPDSGKITSIETALTSTLNDLGFDFVQKNDVVLKLLKKQKGNLSLAIQGNAKIAKEIGTETGAELVILGQVSTEEKGSTGGNMKSVHSLLNLKIVDVGTGSIIATQETYGGDASTNPSFASINAIKYALDDALNGTNDRPGILKQMLKKWNPGNGNEIQLGLEIADYKTLSDFTNQVKALPGVISVDSKGFKPGNSLVVVYFRGSTNNLLDLILGDESINQKRKITVKQQTASQIMMWVR